MRAQSETTSDRILFALRVRDRSAVELLAMRTLLHRSAVVDGLTRLRASQLARPTPDVPTLTVAGRMLAEHRMRRTALDEEQPVRLDYDRFLDLDGKVKQLCSDGVENSSHRRWALTVRLSRVDERASALLRAAAPQAPRLARYADRLTAARLRYESGDGVFLADPRVDSFHNVWFECHEDVLISLAMQRQT